MPVPGEEYGITTTTKGWGWSGGQWAYNGIPVPAGPTSTKGITYDPMKDPVLQAAGIFPLEERPLQLLRWPEEWGVMPESPWHRPTIQPGMVSQPQMITSPTGWQMTPDFSMFISPEGEQLTLAEVQTQIGYMGFGGAVYDYSRDMFIPATTEQAMARQEQYEVQEAQLRAIGEPGFVGPPGTPGAISIEEYQTRLSDYNAMLAEQREALSSAFTSVFPGQTIDDFFTMVDSMVITDDMSADEIAIADELQTDFLETIRTIGRTSDTEFLLRTVFPSATEEDINALFGITMEVKYEEENWFKDNVIDPLYAGASSFVHGMKQTVSSVLPSLITRQPWTQKILPESWQAIYEGQNRLFAELQEGFQATFEKNLEEEKQWLASHPELTPKPEYEENPFDNPGLFLDAGFYAFTISSTLAYSLSVMGTMAAATAATGNPLIGVAAGLGIAGAPEASNMTKELIREGVPFDEAVQWGVLYGSIAGGVETVSNLPLLGLIFKPVKQMMQPFWRTLLKGTSNRLVKASLVAGVIPTIEGFEEVVTEVAHNAILKNFDATQSILEGLDESFIKGVIASLPFAAIGGGASYRSFRDALSPDTGKKLDDLVDKFETQGLTEEQAQVAAANEIARTPEGEVAISEALEAVKETIVEGIPVPETIKTGQEYTTTVYRGTRQAIGPTDEGLFGKGTYYTTSREYAETYGDVGISTVTLKNPFVITSEAEATEIWDIAREARQEIINQGGTVKEANEYAAQKIRETIEGRGHDGIIARNIITKGDEVVVFTPQEAIAAPVTPEVIIPKAEPSMPEAGYQPAMLEEVPEREVRPVGKASVTQLKMDEQLALEEARREEAIEHSNRQMELEGLREWVASEPARKLTNLLKKIGWHKGEIKNLTLRQYRTLKGREAISPTILTEDGKHVKWEYALDDVATELGYKDSDALKEAIEKVGEANKRIAYLKDELARVQAKPIVRVQDLPTEGIGATELTSKQVDAVLSLFSQAIVTPGSESQRAAALELRKHVLAQRASQASARVEELIIEGVEVEAALKQAESEFMSGKLPNVTTDYFADLTEEMRNVLFNKVHNYWVGKDFFEEMSTVDALTNALRGESIPRKKGTGTKYFPQGGSAYDRLARVFVGTPEILEIIDQKKTLPNIIEGMYEIIYAEPVELDQAMVGYLRGLTDVPFGNANLFGKQYTPQSIEDVRTAREKEFALRKLQLDTLLAEKNITKTLYDIELAIARQKAYPYKPVTKLEVPIESAFKQIPLLKNIEKGLISKILKELFMSPIDIGNLLRANKASFDMSFYRQEKVFVVSHPVAIYRATVEAWKSLFSQRTAEASWERITIDPAFELYEKIRLERGSDPLRILIAEKGTAQYRAAEEFGYLTGERAIPRFTAMIPWVKWSGRAFVTGTNEVNWAVWKQCLEATNRRAAKIATGEIKLKEGEGFSIFEEMAAYQKFITDVTQRASLGPAKGLAAALGALFFAPRSKLGRLLAPRHLLSKNPRVRAMAWKDASLFVGAFSGLIMLGYWMDLWDVDTDPRSGEYMSIRIGNMRIDPWGGYRQFMVFYTRIIVGTGVSSVTGQEYESNPVGALNSFFRGALSPMASIIMDFWTGKNFLGDIVEVDNMRQWAERLAPFSVWDVWEAYEENWLYGAIAVLPAIWGEGVQTYTGDWRENWANLGIPKYLENTAYGINEPVYDLADWWADTAAGFRGVDPATLTERKGYPPSVRALAEALQIIEMLDDIPNQRLTLLNADPEKGTTFAQYYQMWQDRLAIVASGDEEALKVFDQDERTRNANLGNMTQRQYTLLLEYHSLSPTEQAQFLKDNPELYANPREEWLRTHPNENALLALFGKANIFSVAAYNQTGVLAKTLDVPDNAMVLRELDRVTQLNLQYFEQNALEDVYSGLDDTVKDDEGLTARDKAMNQLKKDNPDWVDDMRRIEAIKVGTDLEPTSYDNIEGWADRGHVVDEFGAGSIEAKVWLLDNPEVHKWALDRELLTDDGSKWNEPILRLQAEWTEDFDQYASYGDTDSEDYISSDDARAEKRQELLYSLFPSDTPGELTEFGRAYYTKAASGEGYSEKNWSKYVEFVKLPTWGSWRERFLLANRDFYGEYVSIGDHSLITEDKVKPLVRDNVYSEFYNEFKKWDDTGGMTEDEVRAMHESLDMNTDFRDARYRVDAYDNFIPAELVEDYVEWYTSDEINRPEGYEGDWYEDDWWLMEHKEFYEEMVSSERWSRKDFSKIPTREVFDLYRVYQSLPLGSARMGYRIENPELDAWLVLSKGYKPATGELTEEQKVQLTLDEEIAQRLAEMSSGGQILPVFRG